MQEESLRRADPVTTPTALVRKELLVAIRGSRSQNQLNRRLGYSFNQLSRWENGHTRLPWSDFARLCALCGRSLSASLKEVFGHAGDPSDPVPLLAKILGTARLASIAERTGYSRFALSRWKKGTLEPSFDNVLDLMRITQASHLDWLQQLVGANKLPCVAKEVKLLREQREIHFKYPYIAALIRCLELVEYNELPRHRPGFIARKIGVTLAQERVAIRALVRTGGLRWDGKHYRNVVKHLSTRTSFAEGKDIRLYWARRGTSHLAKLPALPENELFGYLVFSSNDTTVRRIRERYFEFFQDVSAIIRDGGAGSTSVQVLNLQLFRAAKDD